MKPELLAPAGDLEKVRIALLYGADAVYIGGDRFSLRARASKFDLKTIGEACDLAHKLDKKLYVALNIIPHNEDLSGLDEYLQQLEKRKVDAIIVSDPYVIERAKALTSLTLHLSTQMSSANSLIVNFWHGRGLQRVVLARELTLKEIAKIRQKTTAELEVFIHGGMCVAYSGRCTLSNAMSLRDANRGGCAHSCRWEYELFANKTMLGADFQMASKDLSTLQYVPELIAIGVDSLKIEGRMKSVHYIASVVKTYRRLIDDCLDGKLEPMAIYEAELTKAENRESGPGFLAGVPLEEQQIYAEKSAVPTKEFCGIVLAYDASKQKATVEQRNFFAVGDTLEVFRFDGPSFTVPITGIRDENGVELDAARHPLQTIVIDIPKPMKPYYLLRRQSQ